MEAEINDSEFEKKYARFETPYNELTPYQISFFNRLSSTLDTTIYYLGSIQRFDYFPGHSDIDVCVFSENTESTLSQLTLLLGLKRENYRSLFLLLDKKQVYNFYKVKYEDPENNLYVEICT